MSNHQTTFYGKKYICSYCGTQFDEDECPSCCSTQFQKTQERIIWEQEQQMLEKEIQVNKAYQTQSSTRFRKRFFLIFGIVFGGIWLTVLFSFLMTYLSMAQITNLFY